jgi:hypothetical protein
MATAEVKSREIEHARAPALQVLRIVNDDVEAVVGACKQELTQRRVAHRGVELELRAVRVEHAQLASCGREQAVECFEVLPPAADQLAARLGNDLCKVFGAIVSGTGHRNSAHRGTGARYPVRYQV